MKFVFILISLFFVSLSYSQNISFSESVNSSIDFEKRKKTLVISEVSLYVASLVALKLVINFFINMEIIKKNES